MRPVPTQIPFDADGRPSKAWIQWAEDVVRNSRFKGADTTANRPTNGVSVGDWYFDTTLGKPVWVASINPSVAWVDATGTAA